MCVCVCDGYISVSYRVFNCILAHFIPLPVFICLFLYRYLYVYSFTGIYILLILFLYPILSTLFPRTMYGLIFTHSFSLFYSIFVYSYLFYLFNRHLIYVYF